MLTESACKTLIEIFDSSNNKERIDNFLTPQFTQVNLNELAEKGYQKFTQLLCYKVLEIVKEYKKIEEDLKEKRKVLKDEY